MRRAGYAGPDGGQHTDVLRGVEIATCAQQRVTGLIDSQRILSKQFAAECPARSERALRQ